MNKTIRAKDFKSTEEFIRFCQKQGADVEHDYGDNWIVRTSRGTAHVKRSCKTLPIEKRGVLSYLAWGLGLLTVFGGVAFVAARLMGVA
jgi:hypothetical protein